MKMVAAQLFGGRNDAFPKDAFLKNAGSAKSRRINLLSIALALAAISTANVCRASDDANACAFALKDYLEGGEWNQPAFAHAPCDERKYEDLKHYDGFCQQKIQQAHALCQSIKATQRDFDDCNQMDDSKRTKIGCTRVINDQSQSLADRVSAFVQVGNSYVTDYGQLAKYYYARAIQMDPRGASYAYAARAIANWKIVYRAPGQRYPYTEREFAEAISDYRAAYAIDPVKMDQLTASSEDLQKIRAAANGAQSASPPAPIARETGTRETGTWLVIAGTWPPTEVGKLNARLSLLSANGIRARIVKTDDYPKLSPGLSAVVLGPFSKDQAQAQLSSVQAGVPDAFIKEGR
jgi:tetratricopeptide (TPR) repeat protein